MTDVEKTVRRNTGIGFGTSKLLSVVSVINRLGQQPHKARALLDWRVRCDSECPGRLAGMLAACVCHCPGPGLLWGGQEESDAEDQGISRSNGESLYSDSVHQICLSVINVLNWQCMSTCGQGRLEVSVLDANIYKRNLLLHKFTLHINKQLWIRQVLLYVHVHTGPGI